VVLQATSAADDAARGTESSGAESSGAERYAEALAVLPGAEHVAVVDVAGERVLAEWGGPPGSARAVLDRARREADPSRHGRRELDDIVSTTGSAFHLSRLVLAGPGHPESVWVAVRINRARGNLTWSRGVLAGLGGPAGASVARAATPAREVHSARSEAADDAPRASQEEGAASASYAPAVVPPPPPPAPAITSQSAAPVAAPPAPKAQVVLKATAAPLTLKATPAAPTGPVATTASASTGTSPSGTAATSSSTSRTATREPSTTDSETGEPSAADTAIAETATTAELVAPRPTVPAARTSPENRPEPPPAGPDRRSSFAPVMVVPPPPSPVPDDGTSEEPAPMPAPIITAPPLLSDGRGVEGGPAALSGPDESGEAGPPDHARPGLPQRTPGVHLVPRLPSPTSVPPSRPATSGTGATAFTDEPSALRRLINGLRRPS
jgi:hypothetical protein